MPKRDKNIKEITLKSGAKRYKYNTYIVLDPVTGERVFANGTYDKVRLEGTRHYSKPKQKTVDEVYAMWFETYKKEVKESSANKVNINYSIISSHGLVAIILTKLAVKNSKHL